MNRRHAWMVASIAWLLCGGTATSSDPAIAASAKQGAVVNLCTSDGKLNMERAKTLQDQLRKADLSRERLLDLAANLQGGVRRCRTPMSLTDMTFLTGLQVTLGDRFLSMHEFAFAREALSTANTMFERSNLPNDVWLHALELAAHTEIGSHDLLRASEIAADEVKLARSWVSMGLDKKYELMNALRFQAYVLTKGNEPTKAAEATREADSLEVARD